MIIPIRIFFSVILISSFIMPQSENEIKRAKEFIKKTGMTESQVRAAAKKQGYTDKQINDAIKKDRKQNNQALKESNQENFKLMINNGNSGSEPQADDKRQKEVVNEVNLVQDDVENEQIKIKSEQPNIYKELNYFGYDIFKRDPDIFQSSSVGAVDPNFLIGPGDEIIINLWGETEFRQVLTVNREGFIFITEIGQVFVNGLNFSLLESKLFRVLSQSYASLDPKSGKATTFLDISLGNLRPIRIQVLGEVAQPGAYTVTPSATLFSSLYYFNGPTNLGSLRDIRLIRNNKIISSIDFYDYLLTGTKPKDEKLQYDDVIFIPKRLKSVSIQGEINRPAIYELKEGETFIDLLNVSGGLKISAYLNRSQIDRIIPFNERESMNTDRLYIDVDLNNIIDSKSEFQLNDGDQIRIFSITDMRTNNVEIEGAVSRPGIYHLGSSMTLKQLIIKADSLLGDAYQDRVDITRTRSDYSIEIIKLNLLEAMEGNPLHNIPLEQFDKVRIYGMTEMTPQDFVSIEGHVKNPGRYLLKKNMSLHDLIFIAGGYLDKEFKSKTFLDRAEIVRNDTVSKNKQILPFNIDSVLSKGKISKLLLEPDDNIRVYSINEIKGSMQYVTIEGHVKNPGDYELYEANMTIYDLLFKAGGFDDQIHYRSTFLKRADLIRFDDNQINKKVIPFNLGMVLDNKFFEENFTLSPGDKIRIYSKSINDKNYNVFINGDIENPGNYTHKTNMTLKDLLFEAGGVKNKKIKYQIEVARIPISDNFDIKKTDGKSFYFDLNEEYKITSKSDPSQSQFFLEPFDFVSIRPKSSFEIHKKVMVKGAVKYPGEYRLLRQNEKIYDIIQRAGGVTPESYLGGSSFTRGSNKIRMNFKKVLKKFSPKADITLQDGDIIHIAISPNMFKLEGEVNTPGFYKYTSGMRVDDGITVSGGFTKDADVNNVFIRYPNGRTKIYKGLFKNPKIHDGSVIFIGRKPEKEPVDTTEFLKETTAIIANLAQALSIFLLVRQ